MIERVTNLVKLYLFVLATLLPMMLIISILIMFDASQIWWLNGGIACAWIADKMDNDLEEVLWT